MGTRIKTVVFLTVLRSFGCVAQLVEWSFPIPEVRKIEYSQGKFIYIEQLFSANCVLKRRK